MPSKRGTPAMGLHPHGLGWGEGDEGPIHGESSLERAFNSVRVSPLPYPPNPMGRLFVNCDPQSKSTYSLFLALFLGFSAASFLVLLSFAVFLSFLCFLPCQHPEFCTCEPGCAMPDSGDGGGSIQCSQTHCIGVNFGMLNAFSVFLLSCFVLLR